jgi:DNA-directed RNA polymerase specialized sigma24 family protein
MQHDEPRQDVATADHWAAERLIRMFDDHVEYLFASLRRLGARPGEIEDLAHEVFLNFLRMKPAAGRRPATRLRLFGLAVRVMARHRRRSLAAAKDSGAPVPLTFAAMDRLPLKRRAVLVLHDLDQVPFGQIAASLSMTRVGVAMRLRQARREMETAIRQLATEWQAGRFGRPDRLFAALGIDDAAEPRGTIEELADLQDDIFLFEMVMDELPQTVYFKDRDSRFTHINRYAAAHYGIGNPALAVGRTDFDFFTDEHAIQALRDEQEIIRTGQPLVSIEEQETLPDGKHRRVWTTKLPLHDRGGKIVGTFGLSRDIAEGTAG